MSERIHALAQVLLGKTSLEECNLEEIQHLTKRYPYFAPAQFLLLQKLEAAKAPEAVAQRQKAVLYFHSPLQFDYLTAPGKFEMDEPFQPVQSDAKAAQTAVETEHVPEAESTLIENEPLLSQDDAIAGELPEVESNFPTTVLSEYDRTTAVEIDVPQPVADKQFLPQVEAFSPRDEPVSTDDIAFIAVTPQAELEEADIPLAEEPTEGGGLVDMETEPDHGPTHPEQESDPVETIPSAPIATASVFNQPVLNLPSSTSGAAPATGSELSFEPFHTVDYFASQGIKIAVDDVPKDRLGKQLRSFTEWLKVMKRLPATAIAVSPETLSEKNVENLASHSVEGSDVVTEAMAEVWLKQGNRQKAMETYNKLSLQNPSKKAYFAAKIENLKGS